jgi:hypothetical protein
MKTKLFCLYFLILSLPSVLLAQPAWICGNTANSSSSNNTNQPPNCTYNSVAYNTRWGKQSNYVPNNTQPIITVKYALHIFDTTSQTSFAYKNNATDLARLNSINGAVKFYSRYSAARLGYTFPNFPPHISDSRVEYECVGIYFYYDDIMFKATQFGTFYNYVKTNFVDNNVDPTRLSDALPIFFTQGALGYAGIATSIGGDLDFSAPQGVLTTLGQTAGDWYANEHILHEIGHLMGWRHKYEDEYLDPNHPDFLSDVFLQNNPFCSSSNVWGTCYSPTCGNNFTPSNNCDNNVMSGQDNKWMSPLQMGRRRRVLSLASTRQYVKDLISDHVNVVNINSNETWDFDIQMYEDIVVKSGNTLKVTCKINMAREGKIIVEKGAQLIVDGGEITTWSKSGAWDGIYIEGSGNGSPQNLGFQGQVEVKNGGTITNAQVAINTFIKDASGNINWGTTGGMIFCDNANFINNIKDVQFMYYHGLAINNNVCTFKNTNFKITGPLNGGAVPDSRVSLYEVNGVNFLGCNFENTYSSASFGNNFGVQSIDARYTIDKLGNTNSTIKGFIQGVYADNTNPLKVVTVKNTDITTCAVDGVYFNNMQNVIFENNTIVTVGIPMNIISNKPGSGLYLNNCKNYKVQNNNFSQVVSSYGKKDAGIFTNNSGVGAHVIYKNNFSNFAVGISPIGNNSGASNTNDGLKMNCNNFDLPLKNNYDIGLITLNPSSSNPILPTVASFQGTSLLSNFADYVRNQYGAVSNINNTTENQWSIAGASLKPTHHPSYIQQNTKPLPQPGYSDVSVNVISTNNSYNSGFCPDNNLPAPPSNCACPKCCAIIQINSAINSASLNVTNEVSNYSGLIDGGNTSTLVAVVNSNMSNGNLKNLLESKSPYLSDEVLNTYFTRSNTPPGHIKDIHALNAPVSSPVWSVIVSANLPNGIMNQIINAQNAKKFSDRDLLYGRISNAKFNLQDYTMQKLNYFLTDTSSKSLDSVIKVLNNNIEILPDANLNLFFAYLEKGDLLSSEKELVQLRNKNRDLGDYLEKLIFIETSNEKLFTLTKNESLKNYFLNYAGKDDISFNYSAKAALKFINNVNYEVYRGLPYENSNARLFNSEIQNQKDNIAVNNQFNLYPNPTNDVLYFSNLTSEPKALLKIEIVDVLGRVIYKKDNIKDQQTMVDTKPFSDGLYLLNVYEGDLLKHQAKFVKSK